MRIATGQIEDTTTEDGKNAAAVALGRMGGKDYSVRFAVARLFRESGLIHRRRAIARKDRCRGVGSHDRDRPIPNGSKFSAASHYLSKSFRSASRRRAARSARHLRKAFPGKWWSERARTATFLSPMAATGLSMPVSDGYPMPRAWRDYWP
jgi:hypothetical protein